MEEKEEKAELDWKTKAYLAGGVIGALAGLGAAYLYIRNIEETGREPAMDTKDAMTIGVSLVSFLRQIASIQKETKKK
ncbi:MAG: hypothetical protein HY872_15660 [Chloroflexi bacterium]|nr:hypothetical protein [Chloroflexota bacterium]